MLAYAAAVAVSTAACGEVTLNTPATPDAGDITVSPDAGDIILPPDAALPPDALQSHDAALPPDAAPPPDAAACVEGDQNTLDPATGQCYMYFATALSWLEARDACASLGAHLATSTGPDEVELLATLGPVEVADIWMGGTDSVQEDLWGWNNGEPMTFTNWRTGEPNDGGTSGSGEDCMVMEVDNGGTWDDRPCGSARPYFCER